MKIKLIKISKTTLLLFFILISDLICTAELSNSLLTMPLQLLCNAYYKNSIIFCGIDTNNHRGIDAEQYLLTYVIEGIISCKEIIKEKKMKIAVLSEDIPKNHTFWDNIMKREKNERIDYCSLYGNKSPDKEKHFLYIMARKSKYIDKTYEKDFYNRWGGFNILQTGLLILIDNKLLQKMDILKNVYNHFQSKKKIIICDPYTRRCEYNYQPSPEREENEKNAGYIQKMKKIDEISENNNAETPIKFLTDK